MKKKKKRFELVFTIGLDLGEGEMDAEVTAEIVPGYMPKWDEYWGGDPGDPGSVEVLTVIVNGKDISGELSTNTIAYLEEVAWVKAEKYEDDYENDEYDRHNDR